MTVYEHGDEIVVVDAGLAFPRDEHLGVDLVLPDIGYLRDRKRVNAVVLTHGHEDHVGGLPYLLREVDCDRVIATKLTLGLIKSKLDEHGLSASTELQEAETGKPIQVGSFTLDFVRVAHSIPDCVAVVLETDAGRVVHTGDWKLDHTPVDGLKTDVGRFAELGNQGVDLLLGDSTNAERPGMTGSERLVGEAFRTLMPLRKGRILVVSFASNVHRMQQAIDVADPGRTQGRDRRPLDAQEPQHRPRPRLPRRAGAHSDQAAGGDGAAARPGDDPLHGQPGRADVRADADRLQRPPVDLGRARRHRDHLGEAGAGQRAPRPRLDQPPREGRRRGAAPGDRARARLRPRVLRGDAHDALAAPAARDDAGARRVPDARGARAARARVRRARGRDHHRRERLGRSSSSAARRRGSSTGSKRASPSSTASASATSGTWR